jgi:diaminopimelate epimerase
VRFRKYEALGNDYLIVEVADEATVTAALVRRLCDRHFGVGSDGVLLGRAAADGAFTLRIFNPDGSEAEKSGNGLRIFARYLWDTGRVGAEAFTVVTAGGVVRCQVSRDGAEIVVEMGRASFDSARIPVAGPRREVVAETIALDGEAVTFTGVGVGNPHCVIHRDEIDAALARRLGPALERHALFPNRTNVQLVKVLDRHAIQVEIWERGAGYTLASGSSACAAAAASVRLGLCDGQVTVHMPGGQLVIDVAADFALTMRGPARPIATGELAAEWLSA